MELHCICIHNVTVPTFTDVASIIVIVYIVLFDKDVENGLAALVQELATPRFYMTVMPNCVCKQLQCLSFSPLITDTH